MSVAKIKEELREAKEGLDAAKQMNAPKEVMDFAKEDVDRLEKELAEAEEKEKEEASKPKPKEPEKPKTKKVLVRKPKNVPEKIKKISRPEKKKEEPVKPVSKGAIQDCVEALQEANYIVKEKVKGKKKVKVRVQRRDSTIIKSRVESAFRPIMKDVKPDKEQAKEGKQVLKLVEEIQTVVAKIVNAVDHFAPLLDVKHLEAIKDGLKKISERQKFEQGGITRDKFRNGGEYDPTDLDYDSDNFVVMNETDGVLATPIVFRHRKSAEQFVADFPKRYEAQGYYRDSRMNKIAPKDVVLRIIDLETASDEDYDQMEAGEFARGGRTKNSAPWWIIDRSDRDKYERLSKEISDLNETINFRYENMGRVDTVSEKRKEQISKELSEINNRSMLELYKKFEGAEPGMISIDEFKESSDNKVNNLMNDLIKKYPDRVATVRKFARGGVAGKKPEAFPQQKVYIDFLNKEKNFRQDRKYFDSYAEAERWAKKTFERFDPDMIKYEFAKGGVVDQELTDALNRASSGSVFSSAFVDKFEFDKATFTDWKFPNAKELAYSKKKEMIGLGYVAKVKKTSFQDLARGDAYSVTWLKRKDLATA
jgi:hypothetical protein